jgi:hypothetical protein
MCIIAQVSSITSHRVAINTGFNINYGLPFRLKDFYSPIYWARSLTNTSSPFTNFFEKLAESKDSEEGTESEESFENGGEGENEVGSENDVEEGEMTTEMTTTTRKPKRKPKMKREAKDLTAGEFYYGIKELMS